MKKKVEKGDIRPGLIMIDDRLYSFWIIPYSHIVKEFERLGVKRASRA